MVNAGLQYNVCQILNRENHTQIEKTANELLKLYRF